MPEIPEIRAHAERLTAEFDGAVLETFVPISFTALKTYAPAPDVAYGSPLLRVGQRGKYLSLVFEPATFVVHLMQGGRLKPDEKQSPKPRGGLARWVFADGRALLLSEAGTEKRAGVWVVEELREGEEPIAHLGPDADSLDAAGVAERIGDQSKRLHGVLRDQHPMAGIGRRLANEITHKAKLVTVRQRLEALARGGRAPPRRHPGGDGREPGLRAGAGRHELVQGTARRRSTTARASPAPSAATRSARWPT